MANAPDPGTHKTLTQRPAPLVPKVGHTLSSEIKYFIKLIRNVHSNLCFAIH